MGLFKKKEKSADSKDNAVENKVKKEKKKKGKKQAKVEPVYESQDETSINEDGKQKSDIDEFLGIEESPDDNLTEKQRHKKEKLESVKSKISKILQSSNIEIIDENFGDEYDYDTLESSEKSEQDYDSLKALFGDKDKNKKQELTLTIDDFDYAYVGQYLEEYDLMHMKNIKRVKLIRKKNPKLRKFLIAASVVLVIGIGVFLGIYFTRETPVYLKSVSLNQTERSYYLNDVFDYTGLYFIAEYSDGTKQMIDLKYQYLNDNKTTRIEKAGDDKTDIKFTLTGTANLFFTYNGFDVEYVVNVVKKEEIGFDVIYADDIFNLDRGEYITSDLLQFLVKYKSYGKELIEFSDSYQILIDGVACSYSDEGYLINTDITSTSTIIIRTRNAIRLEDGSSSILSVTLVRGEHWLEAQKEN